ncbi:hypothetical protein [Pararhodonellum marinum]|uniref:hypothetical protein n=1 Tax=Pararhodonellum marinum TaxID=2755358 RepID=UPI00188FCD05|nr:hypothetical protein [Pararhodonellum marinum]
MKKLYFVIVFFLPLVCISQTTYKGKYVFNGEEGDAEFQFRRGQDDKLIKDGFFEFFRKYVDSVDQTTIYRTEIKGRYSNDIKTGRWVYDVEKHKVFLEDVVDFEVVTDLESEEANLTAHYERGLPHGLWDYKENVFTRKRLEAKASATEVQFDEGKIIGKFQYKTYEEANTHYIIGEVDEDGIMVGEWTFVYEKDDKLISEVRNYEMGYLLGLVKRDLGNGDLIEELVYFPTIDKLNLINNNQNEGFEVADKTFSFVFNDGFKQSFQEYQAQVDGNEMMVEFTKKILRFENDYINSDGEIIKYPFNTKRFKHDLTKEEERIVAELPDFFGELEDKVEFYATKNALYLNRGKTDSLAFAYQFFQYYDEKLDQLEELLDIFKTGEAEYIDTEYYIREGLEFITPTDAIQYEYGGEELERILTYEMGDEKGLFEIVYAYLQMNKAYVDQIGTYVESQVSLIEQDEQLQELEAGIAGKKASVDSLYVNYQSNRTEEVAMMRSLYQNILNNEFNRLSENYAQKEGYADRLPAAEKMLDLLNEMERLHERIGAIYPNNEDLDDLYQEETFNPFTYTRYDQRTKERIYINGAEVLFGYYVDQLRNENDYTQIKEWVRKLEKLDERMIELRTEDTRRLERRLRGRVSPDKVESLFDL